MRCQLSSKAGAGETLFEVHPTPDSAVPMPAPHKFILRYCDNRPPLGCQLSTETSLNLTRLAPASCLHIVVSYSAMVILHVRAGRQEEPAS